MANRIASTTREGLAKVVDTVLTSNVLAKEVLTRPKKWRGRNHVQPVRVTANTNGQSFSGFDTLPTSATDTTQNMTFTPKAFAINVGLPRTEIDLNQADAGAHVTDLIQFKLEEAALDMAEDIGTIFYGDGTGNSSKDFLGLEAIVDDGTNAATIGGLTRATYSTLDATVTAASTLTLNAMSTLYNTVSDGSLKPSMIFTTKTVHALYEQLLQSFNQYLNLPAGASKYTAGATELAFKGIPVMSDAKCTSGVMYFLNMDQLYFAMLPSKSFGGLTSEAVNYTINQIDGTPDESVKGLGFSWTGWQKSYNQYAANGFIILQGELVPMDPGRNGKLTGITTV